MTDQTDETPSCSLCSYWAPNLSGEVAEEGVCRKLVEKPRYYGSLITEARDRCDQWARLGFFEDENGEDKQDRRVAFRSRINLPARLYAAEAEHDVWLADLSENGAGISMSNPPEIGLAVVLKWASYKICSTIAWANQHSCGVVFDRPISTEIVYEAVREGALKNDRSAKPSRIALGKKRSSLHAV